MTTTKLTYRVRVSPPSGLRTELNVVAAVLAVGICLVILALLADASARRAAHHPRTQTHAHAHALGSVSDRLAPVLS
jgi:hypothetical protein